MSDSEATPPTESIYEQRLARALTLIMSNQEFSNHPFNQSEEEYYVYALSEQNKKILFFGATHTHEPGHEQFDTIQKQFNSFAPEIVCVEGNPTVNERTLEVRQKLTPLAPSNLESHGEGWYTLKLAVDAGIDFESPEPDFTEEIQHELDQGHSKQDIFTYYLYRMIDQYIRVHGVKSATACEDYLRPEMEQFISTCGWSRDDVASYFEIIIAELDIQNEEKYRNAVTPVPYTGTVQAVTNDVARLSSQFRDEYILKRLAYLMNEYDRVFILFGSAHAVRLEPAMKTLLGVDGE